MQALRRSKCCSEPLFLLVASCVLAPGCGPEPEGGAPQMELWDESGEPLSKLPPVARLHLRGLYKVPLEHFLWVRGDVSSTNSKKLRAGEIPETVDKNRLALSVWSRGDEVVLAPRDTLLHGERYTLAALEVGTIAELDAGQTDAVLYRRWGIGPQAPGDRVPYCIWEGLPFISHGRRPGIPAHGGEEAGASLGPEVPSDVEFGLDVEFFVDHCLTLVVPSDAQDAFVPPASLGDGFIHPEPILLSEFRSPNEEKPSAVRQPAEGDGCAHAANASLCVDGAALMVTVHRRSLALEVWFGEQLVGVLAADGAETPIAFGPLEPETTYQLRGKTFEPDRFETAEDWSLQLATGSAQPRFVLTELMVNPAGPEPEGEWIEIQNVGTAQGSLLGFSIWDDGGGVQLSEASLQPGGIGLIVRDDFQPFSHVPHQDATPIFVAQIGKNGLRNSGERVELRNQQNQLVSAIPAIATKEDVSLARVNSWAPDVPGSFAEHAADGASPGSENVVSFPTGSSSPP